MLKRLWLLLLLLPLIFLGGLLPAGSEDPAPEMEIYLVSNDIHFDILLPMKNQVFDWTSFVDVNQFKSAPGGWIELGWGDRDFYQAVPTWDKFTVGIAFNALFIPGPAAMHVRLVKNHPTEYYSFRRVNISHATYQKLVNSIQQWFVLENGRPVPTGYSYGSDDNFYEARGSFSLLFTCNVWVAEILKDAGLPHPLWSPTKYGLEFLY